MRIHLSRYFRKYSIFAWNENSFKMADLCIYSIIMHKDKIDICRLFWQYVLRYKYSFIYLLGLQVIIQELNICLYGDSIGLHCFTTKTFQMPDSIDA